jgi:hypothetical protein
MVEAPSRLLDGRELFAQSIDAVGVLMSSPYRIAQ